MSEQIWAHQLKPALSNAIVQWPRLPQNRNGAVVNKSMHLFKVGQLVRVNKLGHARHGQVGEVLYHSDYDADGPTREVIAFEKFPGGNRQRCIACKFEQSEIESMK